MTNHIQNWENDISKFSQKIEIYEKEMPRSRSFLFDPDQLSKKITSLEKMGRGLCAQQSALHEYLEEGNEEIKSLYDQVVRIYKIWQTVYTLYLDEQIAYTFQQCYIAHDLKYFPLYPLLKDSLEKLISNSLVTENKKIEIHQHIQRLADFIQLPLRMQKFDWGSFSVLPMELLFAIFSGCNPEQLVSLRRVNKSFCWLMDDETLWKIALIGQRVVAPSKIEYIQRYCLGKNIKTLLSDAGKISISLKKPGGNVHFLCNQSNTLWVASTGLVIGIHAADLSSDSVYNLNSEFSCQFLGLNGNCLFVFDYEVKTLHLIDYQNLGEELSDPIDLSALANPDSIVHFELFKIWENQLVLVTSNPNRLRLYDLSNLNNIPFKEINLTNAIYKGSELKGSLLFNQLQLEKDSKPCSAIEIWDLKDSQNKKPLTTIQFDEVLCKFHVAGDYLYTASREGEIKKLDLAHLKNIRVIDSFKTKATTPISCLKEINGFLFIGSALGQVEIRDLRSENRFIRTLNGRLRKVTCIESCGNRLCIGFADGYVYLWNLPSGVYKA